MSNVLVAEDNLTISTLYKEYIEREGYKVYVAQNGQDAIDLFVSQDFDLVLLDVVMPVMDGFDTCRNIRKISNVPIMMVTGKGEDFEKIMGLGIGADEYIVKPCSPGEIVARMRAILRRIYFEHSNSPQRHVMRCANLEVDMDNFSVSISGRKAMLTKKELEILWTLAQNKDKVFTRENLLNSLWGYDYYGDCRTVDSHIKRLRAKLDMFDHPEWNIKTIWGMGYKFEVYNYE
ncbi:MAG: response regulator transcription factor [Oscillospiraceae bacterium]|nr:response regulator transcription factor [Oscillospiraceae bacterium]